MKRREIVIWALVGAVGAATAALFLLRTQHWKPGAMVIQGAVIRHDQDSQKELPISDALVTASDGATSASARSDASGYFKITFRGVVWPGRRLDLSFRRTDYRPLDLTLEVGPRLTVKRLFVAAMEPVASHPEAVVNHPLSVVSNIRVRYTVNSQSEENIGSAVKTFQVVNRGDVPCNGQTPCSADGNWKASIGTASLDAGAGNEFRNVRASCIAGPCPFTHIDSSGFVKAGRTISVSALDWSDTATFVLEAEVFHATINSNERELYPVIFGRTLNFTLPPTQEGVSIEAEVDGAPMVFPLGPELYLSWATCNARNNSDPEKTTVYRCELKPGYRF